jgi:hypothetical protein
VDFCHCLLLLPAQKCHSQRTIEIEIVNGNGAQEELKTCTVLRLLVNLYAPGFASTLANPRAQALRLRDVSFHMFEEYLNWLRGEYY